jgi:uridylate kinase
MATASPKSRRSSRCRRSTPPMRRRSPKRRKPLKKAAGKEPLLFSSVSRDGLDEVLRALMAHIEEKREAETGQNPIRAGRTDPMNGRLSSYRRIVVKIGSALLVDRKSGLKSAWLKSLASDIAELRREGHEVLVVSSGAIAMGRTVLDMPSGSLKLEESQAAAAVGQIALARAWDEALGAESITTGQVLVTIDDTEARRRYLNARATIGALLRMGAVPVINENDTVATNEIRYGDNDRLAARVATMMNADLLVILSDVDGLYTASPALDPDAKTSAEVRRSRPKSRRWPAKPHPNCRAAACAPKSRPARSPPRPARR